MSKIPIFFHPDQLKFRPMYEWAFGNKIKHPETTKRAENIYNMLKKYPEKFEFHTPKEIPLKAIRSCHSYNLITLYNSAKLIPEGKTFFPSVFPKRDQTKADPNNIMHAGSFCFDSGTPLNSETWKAASLSAASAYEAAKIVIKEKSPVSYSLSRPPGHHASKDLFGGYCYLNNAAIAAKQLCKKGKVAILDLDFHHGNGTQDIFYKDDSVLFISIHGEPNGHYPFFCGYASETGKGKGEGFNLNFPLPADTNGKEFLKVLKNYAIPAIQNFGATYLVISAGFDTYTLDKMGTFNLETEDFHTVGHHLGKIGLPTVVVQEGGYYTKGLGKNVMSFLDGFVSDFKFSF